MNADQITAHEELLRMQEKITITTWLLKQIDRPELDRVTVLTIVADLLKGEHRKPAPDPLEGDDDVPAEEWKEGES